MFVGVCVCVCVLVCVFVCGLVCVCLWVCGAPGGGGGEGEGRVYACSLCVGGVFLSVIEDVRVCDCVRSNKR